MHLLKDYQDIINQGIMSICYPENPQKLYDPIRYFNNLGGKRIRPVLTLLAAEMYDCSAEKSLNAALAIEVFHNFTLMHDDIMDNAFLRRGKATVHEKWNSSVAILAGDAMLVTAYQLLAQNEMEVLPELLSIFNSVAIEVCQGQQFDMDFEEQDEVSIEEYINMIRLKTAVLLGAALKIGASLGNAPAEDAMHLQHFGVNVGLAFQLQDDLLDVYGEVDQLGKHIGGDILANKKTFLMLKALQLAEGKDADNLKMWIESKDDPKSKIREITRIYDNLNVYELTRKEMALFVEEAYDALEKINLPKAKKEPLKQLAERLLLRDR